MTDTPKTIYRNRIRQERDRLGTLRKQSNLLSWGRLITLLGGVCFIWFGLRGNPPLLRLLYLPFSLFVVLVILHAALLSKQRRARRIIGWYKRGLDRINDRWRGGGNTRTDLVTADHPYAMDLDIFGEGSLFELLCTAQTQAGEEQLAAWLSAPAPLTEIEKRHRAVAELAPELLFREKLALIGRRLRGSISPADLQEWAEGPEQFGRATTGIALLALGTSAAFMLSFFGWLIYDTSLLWIPGPLLAVLLLRLATSARTRSTIVPLSRASRELTLLGHGLKLLEQSPYKAPLLNELREALSGKGLPPSRAIAQLNRKITWLDSMRNQIFAPVAFFALWDLQFACAIERWRTREGHKVKLWLSTIGQLEAIAALATYHFEHPADPFPTVDDTSKHLVGSNMGHPLMPADRFVTNSITFEAHRRIYIVSGSNMSGKSTFLRTVGVNIVLAMAGSSVRAKAMNLCPMAIGSSLKIADSLAGGVSKFYAEISRLRIILALTEQPLPLLFLIDEIFQGTNSHDRQQGAQAVLQELLRRGAMGMVTTHDLALAQIPETDQGAMCNVHFSDALVEGELHFDYSLKEGVVDKSNAIELMRSVGLPV